MIEAPIIIGSVILVLVLLFLGVPIAAVLILTGVVGIAYLQGIPMAMAILARIPHQFAASWTLSSLPMFLMMGYFAYEMGMATKIYNLVRMFLGRVPGALAVATTIANAGFGAVSGSSAAATAAFSKTAVPEMLRDGYDKGLATACVASAGTFASLIPPSILMIVYASLAEVSVGKCFMAGVVPGILEAIIFGAMITLRCKINPRLAPAPPRVEVTPGALLKSLLGLWDFYALVIIIFGGIYSGFVTATEAGALSAFAALLIGVSTRSLSGPKIKRAVIDTVKTTGMILIIAVGANIFVRFLAFAGVHEYLETAFLGFSPIAFVALMFIVYILLGMFIDPIGMMLLTIPVLMPVFPVIGINLVWFCVLVIMCTEMACLTPPVGLTVFVVKGVVGREITTETIFKGVAWFLVIDVVVFWILAFFPAISLTLPNLMLGK